ncbi:MAG: PD-(D/E)XK nuclease family protein [Halanaerobiaceae bacterium]
MKFTYLNFQENIFEHCVKEKEGRVFLFSSPKDMAAARKYYRPEFPGRGNMFITFSGLREKLFPVERVIIKEEKQVALFYRLLTEEEKKRLNIRDYFDAIEPARSFFTFYTEMKEYDLDAAGLKGLTEWQQDRVDLFLSLSGRYAEYLQKNDLMDEALLPEVAEFRSDFLQDYQQLVLVNVINFSPRDKEILHRLDKEEMEIELVLQLDPGDFDEEELKLVSVSLPEELPVNLELLQVEEDLLQLVNMLSHLSRYESDCCILDAAGESAYRDLLSGDRFTVETGNDFTRTGIYCFLELLFALYTESVKRKGKLLLRLEDLFAASCREVFRSYYGLDEGRIELLKSELEEDYVYLSPEQVRNDKVFARILTDVKQIEGLRSISDLCDFLQQFDLEQLDDPDIEDNLTKFFDSMLELSSLEEIGVEDSWDDFFLDTGGGLFRLALNYLRYKKVNRVITSEEQRVPYQDLFSAPAEFRKGVLILNASDDNIPAPQKESLLTDSMRMELGLKHREDERREQKYKFLRHLLSARRAAVFSPVNSERNTTISPFIEELSLEYGLEIREAEIAGDYKEIITEIFSPSAACEEVSTGQIEAGDDTEFAAESGRDRTVEESGRGIMPLEEMEFSDRDFSLGYYKYRTLGECHYRFFLQHVAGLEQNEYHKGRGLSPMVIGQMVHDLFSRVISADGLYLKTEVAAAGEKIDAGGEDYDKEAEEQDKEKIIGKENRNIVAEKEKIIAGIFSDYERKIDDFFCRFYREVLLPQAVESLDYFCDDLLRRIRGEIKEIKSEWSPGEKPLIFTSPVVNLYLNGRIDLLLETGKGQYIFDFKTGGGRREQLDFYALLLAGGEPSGECPESYFYYVFEEKFNRAYGDGREKLLKKMKLELERLVDNGYYQAEYSSRCRNCEYQNMCRVVVV